MNKHRLKLTREMFKAIYQSKPRKSSKELKTFLGAMLDIANFIPNFSERTDRKRQLLRKKRNGRGPNRRKKTSMK